MSDMTTTALPDPVAMLDRAMLTELVLAGRRSQAAQNEILETVRQLADAQSATLDAVEALHGTAKEILSAARGDDKKKPEGKSFNEMLEEFGNAMRELVGVVKETRTELPGEAADKINEALEVTLTRVMMNAEASADTDAPAH